MIRERAELIPSLWDPAQAPQDPVDLLVYASNLLGRDPRVTNFGGGNTSAKLEMTDPLTGDATEVLWVKGSGGDLGTARREGFAALYLDKVLGLEARYEHARSNRTRGTGTPADDPRPKLAEDDIVPLYRQATFDLNPAAPSIDTPLHAFVPAPCVSHMHPDAVIAIAASRDAERLTREVYGEEMGWLPWKRPGFELGLMLRDLIEANPGINSAMMGSHGFICWSDTWEECYALTLKHINRAVEFIHDRTGSVHPFGEVVRQASPDPRRAILDLLPGLRGKVRHEGKRLIANVNTSEPVLDFLARAKMENLTQLGTSCPDHFLRTKIRPMVLQPGDDVDAALEAFRQGYGEYYDRCRVDDSPAMRNPNPSVVLLPGVGMVAFGKDAQEARVTGEFYRNAIEVMRGAEALGGYTALPEQEAFNIEYWALEEAKLKRMPPERELSRQVAVVTGAAQGIGRATAVKMASLGAHVVLLDINEEKLSEAQEEAQKASGIKGAVRTVRCDVTDEASLTNAFEEAVLAFGGVDIAVVCAGNARRGTVADTSPEDYKFLSDLLIKGYFDTTAQAIRLMLRGGTGGSIVLVGSKNGTAAGSNAALYSAAKAFELHLMRCTALDYAKEGIRCNAINPDGVVVGSGIWSDAWKEQTAASLGIRPDELVEHYRKRSLLGTVVTPDDCAEAICWLASDARSSRTTGTVIPVDGGNKEGFVR